jgi:hypothetical protein
MNSVAFAGKLLVGPFATADPAVVSHPDSFQRFSFKMINRKRLKGDVAWPAGPALTELEMSSGLPSTWR